ncbi:MAG: hypothetical protein HC790_07180 [Acaryochloridaceae cyanobacterium CSU_3_4]|nr:hypothetical protein [Acaryochloridaceae cyanobacterium CSU_3_4]
MTANDPMAPDFLFLAFIAAIILIIFLQSHSIIKQQTTSKDLAKAQSKISSLTDQMENMAENREQMVEAVQKTQEKLVLMFMALEESKQHAGILPPAEKDQPNLLEGVKEQFAGILKQKGS